MDSDSKPYFKRADLGRFLGIVDVKAAYRDVGTISRKILSSGVSLTHPSQRQNDHDMFVDLEAALEIVVRSRKPKAVELTKWLTRKGVEKVVEDRQKAIEDRLEAQQEQHQKAIDEKDMQIALLDDDLTESQDLVRQLDQRATQLQFSNSGMQGEIRAKDQQIAHLEQRYVHLLAEEKKNYGMTIIAKNDESAEYPYISICGQHGYRKQKKRVVLLKNPGSTEFTDGDTPNAIVTYNLWREHRLIETNPQKPRDFKLVNMEENQLLQLQE